MLSPLSSAESYNANFVVLDIENRRNGDVITIDICWRENGRKVHRLFTNWRTFWNWLRVKASRDERFRVIYAHNGGGWDWLSLCHYLLTEGKKKHQVLTGIIAASKLVTMTVQIKRKLTIHLCDSLQLLRSPLATLAKKFDVTNKIDLGGRMPEQVYDEDRDLYDSYVKADTESLLEILEKALVLLNENVAPIGEFGYTIGSTALKVFRTMLTQEIPVPFDPKVKEFLREGYKGGRVEVFQTGYFKEVTVYDINSLYPYAMLTTDVPISDKSIATQSIHSSLPGAYRIKFHQRSQDIPPVLMFQGIGTYQGAGVYFSPEIHLLREVDPKAEIEILEGQVFLDSGKLFQDYVNRLYSLRLQDKDGPISLLAKYLLNSLYGKFAQNPVRTKLVQVTDFEHLYSLCDDGCKMVPINEELGVWGMTVDHAAAFEHVGIAGMITSQARVILYRGMLEAGLENVLYCDTDSLHVRGLCSLPISDKIGAWKEEFTGEGCYVGKKLYALRQWRDTGWYTKIRAKGVTVGGNNGSSINFDDFVHLSQRGKSYSATYQQPATARQVFAGAKPCTFGKRTRTLRRTAKGTATY